MFGPADQMRVVERGPLEKAGQWTHQYMSAANQLCSTDEMVQGPLGMLWYRDVDVDLPQRHGRGPAPLFYDGLLYHEGINEIVCVDAYNGTEVWRYSLPGILKPFDGDELMGVSGTGSNYCVGDTGVYIRLEDHCLRLDRRTGELLGKFTAPLQTDGQPGTWGYLALEHGRLFGSLANRDHLVTFRYRATTGDMNAQLTESSTLFAMDPESGELKWRFDAKDSIRHNAIAIGDDQVFLIDRPLALFDRNREKPNEQQPTGVLVALDAKTGEEQWRNDQQIDGTTLSLSPEYRKLLMSYQPTRFSLASEIGGRLTVFATDKGEMTWTKQATYASRPLINDYTVYAQGGAWDLLNGDEKPFNFGRSYGCGVLAGSRHMMVYRSATLGYFDLLKNEKTENYGGMRPGCWLNALPAGGLVLVPDASAGCACSYLNQSWVALEPVGIRPPTIVPSGGAFAEAVAVDIQHEDRSVVVRYTLDGTSPGIDSPKYEGPLTIPASAKLRARAFADDGQLSRASNAEFLIERDLLPLEDSKWHVWDLSGNVLSAPSKWSVENGVVHQRSNIYFGSATDTNPEVERYGTLRFFNDGKDFTDGVIEFEVRSNDDDGIGLAFRAADEKRNYLWSTDLQRKFRILAVKDGDRFEVLAKNDKTYQKGVWQQVRIELDGPRITIFVDGEEDFSVADQTFASGTIALHSWGSDNVEFRRIKMRPK
jgi:outer membrane protein assembly factor BamB